ncbi:hypothetical protein AAF712_012550 [Marasmius tenuissimus]|uniref:Uncharacterized protein n=1 Tax=Marasmius tenuissimus TaxID=585030 RepID=A0ABR2ZH85_9AGAR
MAKRYGTVNRYGWARAVISTHPSPIHKHDISRPWDEVVWYAGAPDAPATGVRCLDDRAIAQSVKVAKEKVDSEESVRTPEVLLPAEMKWKKPLRRGSILANDTHSTDTLFRGFYELNDLGSESLIIDGFTDHLATLQLIIEFASASLRGA